MTEQKQIQAVKNFFRNWSGQGYEKGDTQKFWIELLREVFFVDKPEKIIFPEKKVKIGGTVHYIDIFIPSTKVLIEQKSFGVDLDSAFDQAKLYADNLLPSEKPRWIITCNFQEFQIFNLDCLEFPEKYRIAYRMNHANDFIQPTEKDVELAIAQPTQILLEKFQTDYKYLNFLVNPDIEMILPDVQISKGAAEMISKIAKVFKNNYEKNSQKNFNTLIEKICTRLVFCFYASDANIFPENQFFTYLQSFAEDKRLDALQKIFEILNTPENFRNKILDKNLQNFPYVNGGLFSEKISLPTYNKFVENPVISITTFNARKKFSWQTISPPIFGALFESSLNPENQREGGMHYTSVENIHKVIDILFLDDLYREFKILKGARKNKLERLKNFQNKISKLKFFDPACGSGNFLTETYLSLRKLENKIFREILKIGGVLKENPVKVSIKNFFGIEIYSFAVAVAQAALWIAENQMLQETEIILKKDLPELPLDKITTIHHANALTLDWKKILPDDLNFIIGNPPFIGTKYQSAEQKNDILKLCKDLKPLDYVTAWYFKAAKFMQNSNIKAAFVSTNSITQGEQVAPLWKILDNFVHIDFCHRTFKWLSESDNMAAVHCVVIGFSSAENKKPKIIFDGDKKIFANNINGYLQNAPNIYIEKRKFPLCENVPQIFMGSTMVDDDNLNFSFEDMEIFLSQEPAAKKFFRPLIGSEEFIKGKKRFCLWLKDFSIDEIKKFPKVYERVEAVKNYRKKSNRLGTKKGAEFPKNFLEIRQPETDFILIPKVSSENRRYIPIGFFEKKFIAVNTALIIPNANLFHFGILNSSVHNSWMRAVGGRLEMRYQYSASIVYNNFIWCEMSEENIKKISSTGEKILTMRKKFSGWTLAKLYNERSMPEELRAVHFENDMAVLDAYGFDKKITEEEIVAELMKMYKNLTSLE